MRDFRKHEMKEGRILEAINAAITSIGGTSGNRLRSRKSS